jgi:nucleotide sugar dehydrogenase
MTDNESRAADGSTLDLVVIGLGYVGLPLAIEATKGGLRVCGVDTRRSIVDSLTAGLSHVVDVSDDEIKGALEAGLGISDSPDVVAESGAVVMCIPTPLTEGSPDLSAVIKASSAVGSHVRPGALVILESTTYPGTTEEVVIPELERASGLRVPEDLMVAYSPERIDPANERWNLRNTPKVVGGIDDASRSAAAALYGKFCDEVVLASSVRAAEMSKLLENTYRHVNIALVNELALVADDLGVDIFEVIELAASKPFGYQAFYPGPGVGGHCIPIDPHYLSYRLRSLGRGFRFVELAREINDSMPSFVSLRVTEALNEQQKSVSGARIVIAGVAYKANVGDTRESPSIPIVRRLRSLGADLVYVDPHVDGFLVDGSPVSRGDDLVAEAARCDLLLVLTPHSRLPIPEASAKAPLTLDTRGSLPVSPGVRRL